MPNYLNMHILIIDDEDDIRRLLARIIRLEGYVVYEAENAQKGLKCLEKELVHIIICDVKLPDAYGVDLIPELKKRSPQSEVILLTAFGTIEDGVHAIKNGAFDYITKGDDNNRIIPLLQRAAEKAKLQFRVKELEEQVNKRSRFEHIVGESKPLQDAIRIAKRVAPTDTTVLLTGETGVGKEVFAQAIHEASNRRDKPFVAVNCSALGRELLESEMFGHKAGSFTGANSDKQGLFQEAHQGTIFLDEIGEMDLTLQAKMLRVLETGTFLRVGDTKETRVDVRVIAATNRKLEKEADEGRFRLDLFYRLSVFSIPLPSLQERREDIPMLAEHFVQLAASRMNRRPPAMDESFRQALINHHWKGNIRELKNVLERAVILSEDERLAPSCLPLDFLYGDEDRVDVLSIQYMEKRHIQRVLAYTKGNKTKAAELLGIGLSTLYRKMEEYAL
jgi:two-component system NtrC family response regulator